MMTHDQPLLVFLIAGQEVIKINKYNFHIIREIMIIKTMHVDTHVEDGKLYSHLEWPCVIAGVVTDLRVSRREA